MVYHLQDPEPILLQDLEIRRRGGHSSPLRLAAKRRLTVTRNLRLAPILRNDQRDLIELEVGIYWEKGLNGRNTIPLRLALII